MKKFSDFIKKSAEPQKKELASNVIKGRFKIAKSDDDKHLAFGWANVAIRADGEEIEDWQEDIIEPEELENAGGRYAGCGAGSDAEEHPRQADPAVWKESG